MMTPRSTAGSDRPQSEAPSGCRLQRCNYSPASEISYPSSRRSTHSPDPRELLKQHLGADARELVKQHLEAHAARSPDIAERTAHVQKAINKRREFADAQRLLLKAAGEEKRRREYEKTAEPIQERHKKEYGKKFLSHKELMRAEEEIGKKYASKYKTTYEAFSWLDTDSKRQLDRNEIIRFFNTAGFGKSFAIQHFERCLEKDGSGTIDLEEFKDRFCKRMVNGEDYKAQTPKKKPPVVEGLPDDLCKVIEDLGHNTYRRFYTVQGAFRSVDTEKDGTLSREDLKRYFIHRGFDKTYSNRVFDAIDSDGSGAITFDEFRDLFGKYILQVEDD